MGGAILNHCTCFRTRAILHCAQFARISRGADPPDPSKSNLAPRSFCGEHVSEGEMYTAFDPGDYREGVIGDCFSLLGRFRDFGFIRRL